MKHCELRPSRLDDVVGQDDAVNTLKGFVNLADSGQSEAFMISGPSGTGKTSLAYALAGELGIDEFWGFLKVDSRKCDIERMDEIEDWLRLSSGNDCPWKLLLIDEAHTMSKAAQDAWLSLLENLPDYRIVVFTTTNPCTFDLIWLSRCKCIELTKHTEATLGRLLSRALVSLNEKGGEPITVDRDTLKNIYDRSYGNGRRAIQILEAAVQAAHAG